MFKSRISGLAVTLASSLSLGVSWAVPAQGQSLSQSLSQSAVPPSQAKASKTLRLTLQEAVMMALENNKGLKLERVSVPLAEANLAEQRAIFDPTIVGQTQVGAENAKRLLGASTEFLDIFSSSQDYSVGLEKRFATGTELNLSLSTAATNRSLANGASNQQVSRLGLSFTQALLQGRDPAVNEALIREAELETRLVGHNLRGFAEALVADTETAFWDYLQAHQQYKLSQVALDLTREQLENTRERVAVGRVAGIEAVTLETEVALRQQEMIVARGTWRQRELELLRLLTPDGEKWSAYRLDLKEAVAVPQVYMDSLEEHVQLALQQRPELQQARVLAEQRELAVMRTRDGLLPVLDVFLTLGKTGYADAFWSSVGNLPGSGFDFATGFNFAYPLGARAAEAQFNRAKWSQVQQHEAIANLEQQVELDLRRAHLQVTVAQEQIQAAKLTRQLQQTRYEAERDRYQVGRTNAYQVVLSQRELLQSQIRETESLIAYLKALTQFYRFEGTLLQRHGVQWE